jgi:hypothetical protein
MVVVILTLNSLLILFLTGMLFRNQRKLRMLYSTMEEMTMEQSKLNFRLFVTEKKQNLHYEKQVV